MSEFQNRGDSPHGNRPPDGSPKTPSSEVQKNLDVLQMANEAKEPKPAMDQESASGQRKRADTKSKGDPPPKQEEQRPAEDRKKNPPPPEREIGLQPPGW